MGTFVKFHSIAAALGIAATMLVSAQPEAYSAKLIEK
jgi:hypothetical protein